jgi:hypothetical protein
MRRSDTFLRSALTLNLLLNIPIADTLIDICADTPDATGDAWRGGLIPVQVHFMPIAALAETD